MPRTPFNGVRTSWLIIARKLGLGFGGLLGIGESGSQLVGEGYPLGNVTFDGDKIDQLATFFEDRHDIDIGPVGTAGLGVVEKLRLPPLMPGERSKNVLDRLLIGVRSLQQGQRVLTENFILIIAGQPAKRRC